MRRAIAIGLAISSLEDALANQSFAQDWESYSLVSTLHVDKAKLYPVQVGDSFQVTQINDSLRRSHVLLPGTSFSAPLTPTSWSYDRIVGSLLRARAQGEKSYLDRTYVVFNGNIANCCNSILMSFAEFEGTSSAYLLWLKAVDDGDWNFKSSLEAKFFPDRKLLFENTGNFVYGFTGRFVGNPPWALKLGAGVKNQYDAAKRGRWFPYWQHADASWGDDPVDAVWSKLGQEYYDSGQYILDFIYDVRYLPEGKARDQALLRAITSKDPSQEAGERLLALQTQDRETAARLKAEAEQRTRDKLIRQKELEAAQARAAYMAAEQARKEAEERLAVEQARKREEQARWERQEQERRRYQEQLEENRRNQEQREQLRRDEEQRQRQAAMERARREESERIARDEADRKRREEEEARSRSERERREREGRDHGGGGAGSGGRSGGSGGGGGLP